MADSFDLTAMVVKLLMVLIPLLHVAPVMVWAERRICSWMQNRTGPNRVGPFGLIQPLADTVKFIFKEEFVPGHVRRTYYLLAPAISVIPAFLTFAVIPFGPTVEIMGRQVALQVSELNVGFVFILAISSLSVYGIIMASWASNSKYAMLGGLRSTAQMISYELPLGLSLVSMIMVYGSVSLQDITLAQGKALTLMGHEISFLPNWGIFLQPVAFIIFLTAVFAETNRLPFDLPEGEAEIVAGYHVEYGGMKWSLFFMAEYLHMTTASGLLSALFFGGWQMLPGMPYLLGLLQLEGQTHYWATVGLQIASFSIKVVLFMIFFIVVRFTLPRFRYDQLMNLGWKILVPISLVNIVVTAFLIAYGVY